jgi:hypothetical protein
MIGLLQALAMTGRLCMVVINEGHVPVTPPPPPPPPYHPPPPLLSITPHAALLAHNSYRTLMGAGGLSPRL